MNRNRPRLSKVLKVLLFFFIVFIIILSVAYFFLAPIAKNVVTAKIGPLFENRLRFSGVGISIPARSVVVKDIILQQPPDFGSGDLLTTKSVYLQVAIKPLLQKQVIINNLTISNPEVNFIQSSAGKTNIEYYLARFSNGKKSKESPAFRFHLDNFSIRNGKISITSPKITSKKPALEITGFNLLFENLNFPNDRKIPSPLKVNAAIATAHPASISGSGNITVGGGTTDFDITTEIKGIDLADFTYLFPDTEISVSSGQADVKAVSLCRNNYLDSNQHVEVRNLKLTGKGGKLGNAILGLPSAAVVKFLENKHGAFVLDFKVTGETGKLKTNLKEAVVAAFKNSFRENLGGSIQDVARSLGQGVQNTGSAIGGELKKTGKELINPLKKLF